MTTAFLRYPVARILLLLVLLLVPAARSGAQGAGPGLLRLSPGPGPTSEPVTAEAVFSEPRVAAGGPAAVAVTVKIGPAFHINPDAARSDGEVVFYVPLLIDQAVSPGPLALKLDLEYQACDATRCLIPVTLELTAETEVIAPGVDPGVGDPELAQLFAAFDPAGWGEIASAGDAPPSGSGHVAHRDCRGVLAELHTLRAAGGAAEGHEPGAPRRVARPHHHVVAGDGRRGRGLLDGHRRGAGGP